MSADTKTDLEQLECFFNDVDTWQSDHVASDDYGADYLGLIFEERQRLAETISAWLEENAPRNVAAAMWPLATMMAERADFNNLVEPIRSDNEYCRPSGLGCIVGSFADGETENQIDVSDHPILERLGDKLESMLERINPDCHISNQGGRYVDRSGYLYTYHLTGGTWWYHIPADTMRELIAETVCDLCRK